jgi:hypothetical protein
MIDTYAAFAGNTGAGAGLGFRRSGTQSRSICHCSNLSASDPSSAINPPAIASISSRSSLPISYIQASSLNVSRRLRLAVLVAAKSGMLASVKSDMTHPYRIMSLPPPF